MSPVCSQIEEKFSKLEMQHRKAMSLYNPEKLKLGEWRAQKNTEVEGLNKSKEYLAILQVHLLTASCPLQPLLSIRSLVNSVVQKALR